LNKWNCKWSIKSLNAWNSRGAVDRAPRAAGNKCMIWIF
jgi:hypothetical protein